MRYLQLAYMHRIECLLGEIRAFYEQFPSVQAVVMGGSHATDGADPHSDVDIYVYTEEPIPLPAREMFIMHRAGRAEVDSRFWETTDEWEDIKARTRVDLMFRSPTWIREQLEKVVFEHVASVGYSTCLWHNVLRARIVFERDRWYSELQAAFNVTYPTKLRDNIVAKNYPLLQKSLSSFHGQALKARMRGDHVSVSHRCSALLASYFDVLFAINKMPHPGEKRLIKFSNELVHRPERLDTLITRVIRAQLIGADDLSCSISDLIEALDTCMNKVVMQIDAT